MKHPVAYLKLPPFLALSRLQRMPYPWLDMTAGLLTAWLISKVDFPLESYNDLFIGRLSETVRWLMGYPVGLKLNSDVTRFLGGMFLWLIYLWAWLTSQLIHAQLIHASLVLFSVAGGLSGLVALSLDLWSAITAHLLFFHLISARILSWELFVMGSLFRLFRGKRRNPLRNRTDSAEYSLDQQLLGTVFFAFVVAMLPTLAVYHLLFLLLRVVTLPAMLFERISTRLGYNDRTDRHSFNLV